MTWLRDLDSGASVDPIDTDVCILGAGPVGLSLACALAKRGRRVAVLEKGGATPLIAAESVAPHFDRRIYRGATVGRASGLGGTSVLWGGQLLPVRAVDLSARPQINALAWPLRYSQLEPHFAALQELLGVPISGFEFDSMRRPAHALCSLDFTEWTPRLSKWLAFGKRNVATNLAGQLSRRGGIQVWLNAKTQDFGLSKTHGLRRVREIIAKSPHGYMLRVQPGALVIAGGALDSARSVIELDEQAGSLSAGVSDLAGRFLHDHLSLRIARVRIRDACGFEERFAPFFEGSTMRTLRMELPPETLQSDRLPALYAHFIAQAPDTSGFAVVRDCLRAVQRRDLRSFCVAAKRAPRALPDIARILQTRALQKRLAFATGSNFFLHVDLEQAPKRENRVYLGNSPGLSSSTGAERPMHIDWDVDEDAPRIALCVQRRFERFWQRNRLDRIADLEFLDLTDDAQAWNHNVHDLYHPAGTTRMSTDPASGVVDSDLKIHGTDNAYVVGSSVFPSMGAANPTFTAMALALRLSHFIDRA